MEALAAVVLVAIVLPVAMRGISLATSMAETARRKAEAVTLAHSKMCELIATGQAQTATLNGDFGPDWPGFHWTAELQNWDSSTLKELDLHVLWTRMGREQQVTVSTLFDTVSE